MPRDSDAVAPRPSIAVALHDYESGRADELPLRRGDQVRILAAGEPGWAAGEHVASGQRGLVPLSYLHTAGLHAAVTASPAARVSVSPTGAASAQVSGSQARGHDDRSHAARRRTAHDQGEDESQFDAAIERHCSQASLSWGCVHQALRSHVGLPLEPPPSPASLAHDLRRLFGAAPPQIAFLRPMLLPPQPMPQPSCGVGGLGGEGGEGGVGGEGGGPTACRYLASLGPAVRQSGSKRY